MTAAGPLPVAVLTGFLGAGKTTLLNFLLRHPQMTGTAVVINEYGDVGLDHHLVQTAPEHVELIEGGCLCCTVRGRLAGALDQLRARSRNGELPTIRRVIIETTGLAEPGPIVRELTGAPELTTAFRLSGVTTVVAAAELAATLDRQAIARAQVAGADQLLISKADLLEAADLPALETHLRRLNPDAPITTLRRGSARPEHLFETRPTAPAPSLQRWFEAAAPVTFAPVADDVRAPAADAIDSFSVVVESPLPEWRLFGWLSFLRSLSGPDLLRVKGLVNVEGQSGPLELHGVQSEFHPPVQHDRWPGTDQRTRLVFITQGWGRETVRSTLNYLLAEAPP